MHRGWMHIRRRHRLQILLAPGDEVKTTTACIDSTCATNTRHGLAHLTAAFVIAPYDRAEAVTVSVVLRDAAGRVLASDRVPTELSRNQPNGPDCQPVCY